MRELKIVLIGAGSAGFGRGAIVDLLSAPELGDFEITLSLVDVDEEALSRMHTFALRFKDRVKSTATIVASTDRREVLPGAHYVVLSVSVNRWKLWEKDLYIPAAYGFRHVNGENGGPGGAFHTLRSLHLVMPIAKDIEELAPEAMLINYTNPESRIILAISKHTKLRAVGLCHGAFETREAIAAFLDIPDEDLDMTIGGINHLHWVLGLKQKSSGRDLLPEFDQRLRQTPEAFDPATRELYELFDHLTYPAPSHPCEYFAFGHSIAGPAILGWGVGEVARNLSDTADDLVYRMDAKLNTPSYELWSRDQGRKIDRYLAGDRSVEGEVETPTKEIMVRIIGDIELNRLSKEVSVNVPNAELTIENLQPDVIVEVPAMVDGTGIHPIKLGRLSDAMAGVCQLQACIQNLLVEAYRTRSKHLLYQAIAIDPVIDDLARARQMIDEMLKVEADYLPEFT